MLKRNVSYLFQVKYIFYWWFYFRNEIPINFLFFKWKWTCILDFGPWSWGALNMGFMDMGLGLEECKDNFFFDVRRDGHHFLVGFWKFLWGYLRGCGSWALTHFLSRDPFLKKLVGGCFNVQYRTYSCQDISKCTWTPTCVMRWH